MRHDPNNKVIENSDPTTYLQSRNLRKDLTLENREEQAVCTVGTITHNLQRPSTATFMEQITSIFGDLQQQQHEWYNHAHLQSHSTAMWMGTITQILGDLQQQQHTWCNHMHLQRYSTATCVGVISYHNIATYFISSPAVDGGWCNAIN